MGSWNTSIKFGIDLIDRDHRRLFDLIDAIQDEASKDTPDPEVIQGILRELREYANYHFKREESLMLASDYDAEAFNPHRIEHEYFETMVRSVDVLYRIDEHLINVDKLMDILREWLITHIGIVDRAYVKTVHDFCRKFKS